MADGIVNRLEGAGMKLKAKLFAVAACAVALCVALVGCGGGGNSADNAANFQGDWVLSSGNVDGQEVTPEILDQAAQLGMSIYMQFNEDGSCVLNVLGSEMQGTWEAKDATTVSFTFEGSTEEAKLEGDELVMTYGDDNMHFKKGAIPAAASEVEQDQEQEAEPEA